MPRRRKTYEPAPGRRGTVAIQDDAAQVAEAAADRFRDLAHAAIAAFGVFRVALSGGSTPKEVYERLAQEPYRSAINWNRIDLFWSDERVVPPDDPNSNYRMVREALLDHIDIDSARVHRPPVELGDPKKVAAAYEQELRRVFGIGPDKTPVFDLILLGVGPDGHTASLFPGTAAANERVRLVVPGAGPAPAPQRISFTEPVLNAGQERIFLATGSGKAAIVRNILEGPEQPDVWPAQLVKPGRALPLWIIDDDAAAELEG